MAYLITDECTNCDKCVDPCPNEAISEGDDVYIIDPTRCTECVGHYDVPQCADVCPVDACITDLEKIEPELDLLARAKQIHPDKEIAASGYPTHFKNFDINRGE